MRFIVFLQILSGLLLLNPGIGNASTIRDYIWGPPQRDFVRPFLEEAKLPHNARWADDQWSPKDWIDSRAGSVRAVIDGFYRAEIITDQYFEDDIPVLEVGYGFLQLGTQDQRRVIAFMDEVFGVTKFSKPGVIHLLYEKNNRPVGVFTSKGLQLQ